MTIIILLLLFIIKTLTISMILFCLSLSFFFILPFALPHSSHQFYFHHYFVCPFHICWFENKKFRKEIPPLFYYPLLWVNKDCFPWVQIASYVFLSDAVLSKCYAILLSLLLSPPSYFNIFSISSHILSLSSSLSLFHPIHHAYSHISVLTEHSTILSIL